MDTYSSLDTIVEDLQKERTEGWDLMIDKDQMRFYKRLQKATDLYEFLMFITIDGVNVDDCLQFMLDLDYRQEWDPFLSVKYPLVEEDNIYYWEIKYPWPMWNRDYVFTFGYRDIIDDNGKKSYVVEVNSVDYDYPVKEGIVRCKNLQQFALFTAKGDNSVEVRVYFSDNPGVSLPTWFLRWVAQTAMVNSVELMRKACIKYLTEKSSQKSIAHLKLK